MKEIERKLNALERRLGPVSKPSRRSPKTVDTGSDDWIVPKKEEDIGSISDWIVARKKGEDVGYVK